MQRDMNVSVHAWVPITERETMALGLKFQKRLLLVGVPWRWLVVYLVESNIGFTPPAHSMHATTLFELR